MSTMIERVTRASCLARIRAIEPLSFLYSRDRIEVSTDRRADCSGWFCYVAGTAKFGPGCYLNAHNTASLVVQGIIRPTPWASLEPGDAIGYCSPTSPGRGGHIAVWLGGDRKPNGAYHVVDHGSGLGPKDRWVRWDGESTGWLHPARLAPWRRVGIIEQKEDDVLLVRVAPTGAIYATNGTTYWHLTPATYPVALAAYGKGSWDFEVGAEADLAAFGVDVATLARAS